MSISWSLCRCATSTPSSKRSLSRSFIVRLQLGARLRDTEHDLLGDLAPVQATRVSVERHDRRLADRLAGELQAEQVMCGAGDPGDPVKRISVDEPHRYITVFSKGGSCA
jgi:hypothetical protein